MLPDERVARVGAFGDRGEHQGRRRICRQILGGVHGDVGPAVGNHLLHLLGEHALPADRVQLGRLVAITRGRHQDVLDVVAEPRAHAFRLPPRERARARRNANHSDSTVGSVGRSNSDARASA